MTKTYSNVTEMIYYGGDHGYKALKDSEGHVLMSSLKKGKKTSGAKDAYEVEIDGIIYTISKVNTKDGKVLSGIDKLATNDNKEILRVQTLASLYLCSNNPHAGIVQANYCFGLPMSVFNDQVDALEQFILNECNGVTVSVDGGAPKRIEIKNITAIPQSAGLPFLMEVEFSNNDISAVIDLGHYTVDISMYDGMNLRAGAKSLPKGAKDVQGELANVLTKVTGQMFYAEDMEAVISRGRVSDINGNDIYLETIKEFNEVIEEYVNSIHSAITAQYSELFQAQKIYIIGGLAAPFAKQLLNKFPGGKTTVVPDARFANAKSYKEVAKMSFR